MGNLAESKRMRKTLRETFGITRLRPGQEEVIASVLNGRNTLAILPTGAGKSLCYQLPALHLPGTTVVVSPLISLMKDQADKLTDAGVDAAQVNSTLTDRAEQEALAEIEEERSDVVFATPERLSDADFIDTLRANKIDLFVIDEAHCISQWGHDFRPAYLQIGEAITALGHPPVLALTATATDAGIEDIAKQLELPDLHVVNGGVYRPNLRYRVVQVTNEDEKHAQLLRLVREPEGVAIVYCATVKSAEEVHRLLCAAGIDAALYHGRLGVNERKRDQEEFMNDSRRVMVATNAFGMGIDKADVRAIVHYQIPGSLEAYYQESGRAGRDGAEAHCTLLYDLRDKRVQQFFFARRYPTGEEIAAIHAALKELQAGDAPVQFVPLREQVSPLGTNKLEVGLKLLKDAGVVAAGRDRTYRLLRTDMSRAELEQLASDYRDRSERDREKLERMVFYAQSALCRWKILLEYFGEEVDWERCGSCDNCLDPPERRLAPLPQREATDATQHKEPDETRFQPGEPVTLPRFGAGVVAAIAGDQVQVTFPNGQTKSFLRDYVKRS